MFEQHKNLRHDIVKAFEKEMVGPGSEGIGEIEEEIISEDPLQRYSSGILYPQKLQTDVTDEVDDTGQNHTNHNADPDELLDNAANIANQYYPSAIGVSFYTNGMSPELSVKVSLAQYRRLTVEECVATVEPLPEGVTLSTIFQRLISYSDFKIALKSKLRKQDRDDLIRLFVHKGYEKAIHKLYNLQNSGWKRVPLSTAVKVPSESDAQVTTWDQVIVDGVKLICIRRPAEGKTLFTVTLVNGKIGKKEKSSEDSFFQVSLKVSPVSQETKFLDYNTFNSHSDDLEDLSLALLYRNKKTYAIGHGCAVSWNADQSRIVNELSTEIIPEAEVPQVKFDLDELVGPLKSILSMKNLSDLSKYSKQEIVEMLKKFSSEYKSWIERVKSELESLDKRLLPAANGNINLCIETHNRMQVGISLLENNDQVFLAFQLANKAMMMQRLHSEMQLISRFPGEERVQWPDYDKAEEMHALWRPFQLAFILLTIPGIVDPCVNDRDLVDLIWFPTGGGKTEAYLGVSAFTIFYRRLVKKDNGLGTAIIMRYTLRLLTAQQFQRASTLICACELIRRGMSDKLGTGEITIGLWIGSSSTPNDLDSAFKILDKLVQGTEDVNPFQVLSCPWCGTKLAKQKDKTTVKGSWGYKRGNRPKRFTVFCTEDSCSFHGELPIKIIDEDIYNNPPTLLFGTVDKFAMMPWKSEIANVFALNPGNNNASPELIIQDELHLISGPLGTIVGAYETALDALCSAKGIRPKIIASTATIRRAGDQVKALYDRDVRQFPPPGINAEDSFFAREATLLEKPGRMYIGIMATGKTQTTMQVRAMSSILQCINELDYSNEVKDKYWTLVGYFNTIRELGKTSTLVEDDIKDQVRRIAYRRGTETRQFFEAQELTSRVNAEDIPAVLEKLKLTYPDKDVVQILLATNMISVGVDVDRLGLMTIINQPKTTSEYIQASSRVGRRFPGLIITMYDGARPRDRSHYEQFTSYHDAFYKYVEPTSVTPFSGPARDRCLHSIIVSLVRHLAGLSKDNDAKNFSKESSSIVRIKELILHRVANIMQEEHGSSQEDIEKILQDWEELKVLEPEITYGKPDKPHLMYPAGKQRGKHWPTLQSMRNVDAECNILVID